MVVLGYLEPFHISGVGLFVLIILYLLYLEYDRTRFPSP